MGRRKHAGESRGWGFSPREKYYYTKSYEAGSTRLRGRVDRSGKKEYVSALTTGRLGQTTGEKRMTEAPSSSQLFGKGSRSIRVGLSESGIPSYTPMHYKSADKRRAASKWSPSIEKELVLKHNEEEMVSEEMGFTEGIGSRRKGRKEEEFPSEDVFEAKELPKDRRTELSGLLTPTGERKVTSGSLDIKKSGKAWGADF